MSSGSQQPRWDPPTSSATQCILAEPSSSGLGVSSASPTFQHIQAAAAASFTHPMFRLPQGNMYQPNNPGHVVGNPNPFSVPEAFPMAGHQPGPGGSQLFDTPFMPGPAANDVQQRVYQDLSAAKGSYLTPPTGVATSQPGGYGNQLGMQRVLPPIVDSTVSQSGLNTARRRLGTTQASHNQMMQSTLPVVSQSEVSTSSRHRRHGSSHRGDGMDSMSGSDMTKPKDRGRHLAEPDTTQRDEDLGALANQNSSSHLPQNQMAAAAPGIISNQMPAHMNNAIPNQLATSNHHFAAPMGSSGGVYQAHLVANQMDMPHMLSSSLHLTSILDSPFNHINFGMDSPAVENTSTATEHSSNQLLPGYMLHQERSTENSESSPPDTSKTKGSGNRRRKSSRIAELDTEMILWKRRQYFAKAYDPDQLWCEDCMTTYTTECPVHKLTQLADKIVYSRAWASLPLGLQIFRLGEDEGHVELGVFAKRVIPKFTQFGPFVAELVTSESKLSNHDFPLMVERGGGERLFYEKSDENKCNWMMFVRPALTYAQQNLVAYQHGQDIFFSVTRAIEIKSELKVWYATHYAERLGKRSLEITPKDMEELEEQLCKFQCYECPKRFPTASALQKHLSVHDDPEPSRPDTPGTDPAAAVPPPNEQRLSRRKRRKLLAAQKLFRKKIQAAKQKKESPQDHIDNPGPSNKLYHWKKRSTNIYLEKTLKKYHRTRQDEALRKSAMSMYRKTAGEDLGENEWVCNSCDLTFENANLLNLHTLTHAAEDVGLEEVQKFTWQAEHGGMNPPMNQGMNAGMNTGMNPNMNMAANQGMNPGTYDPMQPPPPPSDTPDLDSLVLSQLSLACPLCQTQFTNKDDLLAHVSEHGRTKKGAARELNLLHRPYKCVRCWKAFTTLERLQKHHLVHGDEESKPMQCHVCFKRFMNNSALACHMKTHSSNKYYECPICHQGFDQTTAMREHSYIHANADGMFSCPHCEKCFSEFLVLKKHVRGFHTNRYYPCSQCDKVFPRPDKLRLHMLRHSTVREFMCDVCGKLFKRRDKLKEHFKRMHSDERNERDRLKALHVNPKKFVPKVSPTEFYRFIYKCQKCMLGFKRRGMLVNHLAKRHPEMKVEQIPELNLPILKTQRDYYCQYCDKVYKSSSKRKAHILRTHPGADIPPSARKKDFEDVPGVPNPTYSQTVGSVTTMPHQCCWCHKQYASKAKLLQHQRAKHEEAVDVLPPVQHRRRNTDIMQQMQQKAAEAGEEQPSTLVVEKLEGETAEDEVAQDSAQAADLLTQAMSELTQSLQQEIRQGPSGVATTVVDAALLSARLDTGAPTMVQIETSSASTTTSIELVQLNQALQSLAPGQTAEIPLQVEVTGATSTEIQLPVLSTTDGTTSEEAQIVAVDTTLAAAPENPQSPQTTTEENQPVTMESVMPWNS